jgi:hypothetical protein
MTVGMRVTLVHELTHALQDQHFDLDRDLGSDGASEVLRALVEGDAVRVEDAYIDQLSEDDTNAYWDEAGRQSDEADTDLSGVPAVFQTLFEAPYALGEPYTSLLVSSGGQEALDRAFRRPPASELALLDPAAGLRGEKPRKVAQPKLGPGEKKTEVTDLGALMLYTMLASRIDPGQALASVDGWDGDAMVSFHEAGTSCVRFAVAGAGQAAADRLHGALDAWAATLSPGRPTVTADGPIVNVLACDPGASVERGPDPTRMGQALTLPETRSQVMAEFSDQGFDGADARCIGQGVISTFTPEQLADPEGDFAETDSFDRTMDGIVARCTGQPAQEGLTGQPVDA